MSLNNETVNQFFESHPDVQSMQAPVDCRMLLDVFDFNDRFCDGIDVISEFGRTRLTAAEAIDAKIEIEPEKTADITDFLIGYAQFMANRHNNGFLLHRIATGDVFSNSFEVRQDFLPPELSKEISTPAGVMCALYREFVMFETDEVEAATREHYTLWKALCFAALTKLQMSRTSESGADILSQELPRNNDE